MSLEQQASALRGIFNRPLTVRWLAVGVQVITELHVRPYPVGLSRLYKLLMRRVYEMLPPSGCSAVTALLQVVLAARSPPSVTLLSTWLSLPVPRVLEMIHQVGGPAFALTGAALPACHLTSPHLCA